MTARKLNRGGNDQLTALTVSCGCCRNRAGHTNLLDRIAGSGVVLSEYPPETPPAQHRFPTRNRLVAALSAGTVVVEAGIRSAARNTATSAAALGKELMVVPGPITSAMSIGCHELLRSGTAIPVCSVAEILESVSLGATTDATGNPGAVPGTGHTHRPRADQTSAVAVPVHTDLQDAVTAHAR